MFPEKLIDIPLCERIFCNRSLNMPSIQAIGFDMDYTLALYKHEFFEKLAYEETLKKLVKMGYPKEILKWQFDHKYMIRGLVIDKKLGNVLKMDRHRYVKLAIHGFKQLTRDERRKLYDIENVIAYEEPDFALIDTIFSLPEAFLFTQLVDLKENSTYLSEKSFIQLHQDVRKCIDQCHQDGSIKHKVAQNPEKYIKEDPYLINVLEELRLSGRKLFVVTNSLWDYTNVVMGFLLRSTPQQVISQKNWTDYFDIIITGSKKPDFFMAKNPIYEVNLDSGLLKNIENNTSNIKVFQGGHVKLLHDMLNIQKGSEILYVGDHIYGDILRSKKEIGWRTMLVIEELEAEIQIKKINYDVAKVCESEEKTLLQYHKSFHPVWGELMKTGRQNSRFSAQVMNYSCLYTSKLSNLRHYDTNKNFQAVQDFMPHDLDF
ncbi:MAG: HAD-IG family 5'-nucleotidase [Bdellovibrionota bacterium]